MKKKLLVPVICILMMLIGGFTTWAYLTSQDSAVNTFTVGDVAITLDEADVDTNGEVIMDEDGKPVARVQNNLYHLIPGQTYVKDPTIHVDAESEDCFLYVTVKNQIADIEDDTTIAAQMAAKGWALLKDGEAQITKNGLNVYYYSLMGKAGQDPVVFSNFTIDGTVNNTTLAGYETTVDENGVQNNIVEVTAYAIQAAGFNTAEADINGNIEVVPAEALAAWGAAVNNNQF